MKKRIVMLLTVVALMVGMLAMSVSPAFAAWSQTYVSGVLCREGASGVTTVGSFPDFVKLDRHADGWVCYEQDKQGDFRYYENRLAF